jgi:hypothetical protein
MSNVVELATGDRTIGAFEASLSEDAKEEEQ